MHMSKPKFIVLGVFSVLIAVLLLALVVPAMAASPKDGNRGTPGNPANQNGTGTQGNTTGAVTGTTANQNGTSTQGNAKGPKNGTPPDQKGTVVEGTATGSVTITPSSGTAVTLTMPTDAVIAFYSVSGTTYTVERLMVKMSQPTTGTPATPPDQSGTKVEGTASGTITVTPTSGTAVTLTMPTDAVTAVYSVSGTTNTLERLMVKMSPPATGTQGTPPDQSGTVVEGTASGTITVTPTSGTAVTLTMPTDAVTAFYSVSGTTYTLERLMVKMSQPTTGTPGTPPDQDGTVVEGTATGTITVTPSSGTAVTLTMPTDAVTAVYSVSGTTYTLEQLMVKMAGQMPDMSGARPGHNGRGPFGGF